MSAANRSVPLTDRGLAYGDGVFETLRLTAGSLWALAAHHARLSAGCAVLGLPAPSLDDLQQDFLAWRAESADVGDDGVVKLLFTAGQGDRGYARPLTVLPQQYWQYAPLPPPRTHGLTVAMMAEPLSVATSPWQGLKHLNRLPQVWSRAHWPPGVDEVLVYDERGLIHGGTQSNFCWMEGGRWFTPPLAGASIAGTVRAQLIHGLGVIRAPVSLGRLSLATAMVMTNAVRGVEPVARFGGRLLDESPARALQRAWLAMGSPTATDWLSVWRSEARAFG